jgi:hypothetical protein
MDRLNARLRSLAAEDAALTDPSDATVERGWSRLSASLAAPVAAAPIGIVAGVLAIAVLGLSAAAAPMAIGPVPTSVEPVRADAPAALGPTPAVHRFARAPAPPRPRTPTPEPEGARPKTRAVAVDPLVAELRALATARAHLDAGRDRQALGAARKLLRARAGQLAPEARAIEAIAACRLSLPRAQQLAAAFLREHATSPHRKRVQAACRT